MSPSDLWLGYNGPRHPRILLVGEAWGEVESAAKTALVGPTGKFTDALLMEAGILRIDCGATNVVAARPPGNRLWEFFGPNSLKHEGVVRGLHPGPIVREGLARLAAQIEAAQPEVILALGNYPLWALTSCAGYTLPPDTRKGGRDSVRVPSGIMDWRGSLWYSDALPTKHKLIPLVHPAAILRQPQLRNIFMHDLRTRVPQALRNDMRPANPPVIWPTPTKAQILGRLSSMLRKMELGVIVPMVCDIETVKRSLITCIGISDAPNFAMCIPFVDTEPGGYTSYWDDPSDEWEIISLLRRVLSHPKARVIGQNFIYDAQYIQRFLGCRPNMEWDTMLAQHLMFPGTPKGLDYLSSLYCRYHWFWKEDGAEWDTKGDVSLQFAYNCQDIWRTWEIQAAQRKVIAKMGLSRHMERRIQVRDMALDMMIEGVDIDQNRRAAMGGELFQQIEIVTARLLKIAPQEWIPEKVSAKTGKVTKFKTFWPTSPEQLGMLLYDVLKLPVERNRNTRARSTDEDALKNLSFKFPLLSGFFDLILQLRSLGVFYNTFVTAPLDPDGKMRCQFKPDGTKTFRWSSSKNAFGRGCNLQTIPAGEED